MAASCPSVAEARIAFVLDQQVGLKTQALNLQRRLAHDARIEATFVPVDYATDTGLLTRLPLLPGGIRGTLRGAAEIRDRLGDPRRFDAIVWGTWAAKSVPDLVAAAPAFFVMDMTPGQMEAMGQHYGYTRARARLLGGWKRRATARIYRHARHFFPWNDWVGRSLREDWGIEPDRITPISPGVDTELFAPVPGHRHDGPVRLLFVGGDFLRKGGDLLLRWVGETKADVELHLVTRDAVADAGARVVVHRGLTNNSPELVRLYQDSDLFVLPTRADCYSLVALEAMACGLPVVISELGGIPDIVVEAETGFLVAPDDYPALAERLERLVGDPALRQRLGAAGRSRVEERFDTASGIQRLSDTLLRLLESDGNRV
jgi:Glycosyl transferases group 1